MRILYIKCGFSVPQYVFLDRRNGGGIGRWFMPYRTRREPKHTHTHKMRLASKVLLRRWESGVTRQTGRMEKREKRMWRGDSVHLFVHETEASRILPTERNQLHPPTRSRGIHIYICRTSLYTTQAWASQQGPRTKSRTSFFFFFAFPTRLISFLFLSLFHRQQRLARSGNGAPHFPPCFVSRQTSGKFSIRPCVHVDFVSG